MLEVASRAFELENGADSVVLGALNEVSKSVAEAVLVLGPLVAEVEIFKPMIDKRPIVDDIERLSEGEIG
jgi:hypothetical protein